jgi:hypothetical protein
MSFFFSIHILKHIFQVDREEAAVAAKKKQVYRFSVVTKGRELHLAAPDRQAKEQWMRVLRNSISIINIGQQRKAMMGEFDDWFDDWFDGWFDDWFDGWFDDWFDGWFDDWFDDCFRMFHRFTNNVVLFKAHVD